MTNVETTLQQVTIDRRVFATALRSLVRTPQLVTLGPAEVNRTSRLIEVICRELQLVTHVPTPLSTPAVEMTVEGPDGLHRRVPELQRWDVARSSVGPVALLTIGQQHQRGQVTGMLVSANDTSLPVHVLKLIGPGMHRVWTPHGQEQVPPAPVTPEDRDRWSRLIGALGEESWQRLRTVRFCV